VNVTRVTLRQLSSLVAIILLALGLGLVIAGAELFLDGLLASASRLGVSAFAITVAISGFELENLAAGIAANAMDLPGAAAGTFLGGTTFLAIGVSGLAALIAPIRVALPPAALVWTALAPIPLVALGLDGELSRLDGALLVVWFAIALTGMIRAGRNMLEPDEPERKRHPFAWLLGGLAVLTAGGELLAEGIRGVVDRLGVSQTVLGNTVVAAGVEAEEVARVAAPSRRGRGELAVGNVVGTVVHFAAFNAGVIALIKPLEFDEATRYLHLPVALGATLVLCVTLRLRGGLDGLAGVLFLGLYGCYIASAIAAG
jgi:cation:H+ antiporter